MGISKQHFSGFIKNFKFRELFNELGWNKDNSEEPIEIGDDSFLIKGVGEKSGFKIITCSANNGSSFPNYASRKKINSSVSKLFQEHLIIFIDKENATQIWQLPLREPEKPLRIIELKYNTDQDPELLFQRTSGLIFDIDEEDKITIVDVTKRVKDNFRQNYDKVTKNFYEQFKKEHQNFLNFIKGIQNQVNKDWYASLMLNRLMFCYFIQKKGFLDRNKNYLRDKLSACKELKGKNKFYSFYRDFLTTLFHKGLGAPNPDSPTKQLLGKVPYLNGGLFDEHIIEKENSDIEIKDKAFEQLFDFFDKYEWHLDTRSTASGNEINPDVIGYIFEKYINDRAQMGAYYTKEDITGYISKNCIIPYLFDEVKRNYPKAFEDKSDIWVDLKKSKDKYIYDAIKYGIQSDKIWDDIPEDVKSGLNPEQDDLLEKRKHWNNKADSKISLPTEIWREVIDRRRKYEELCKLIEEGKIKSIDDFITYNLDILQFIQDVIDDTEDPELIKHFYKALSKVTILDPTCGSGAFLFAAMNILEDLYDGCLQKMENFISENGKGKYKFFEKTLTQINSDIHPNRKYFIYKSIILNNLYGVDIMNEAVEIAKLRLFLKLVATVDADYKKENLGLEPLPDMDFNIRAGNTLIGFLTEKEISYSLEEKLDFNNEYEIVIDECELISKTFSTYKEIQLNFDNNYIEFKKAKDILNEKLTSLNKKLDHLIHKEFYTYIKFDIWKNSHKPFHWFSEFYEILNKEGFDIIIGNPPYVVYSPSKFEYRVFNYDTLSCGNLYAFCAERSYKLLNNNGKFGMILPNSSISADKLAPLQDLITENKKSWVSNFAWRPAKLFEGANMLLAIILSTKNSNSNIFSTKYYKWYSEYRNFLFGNISYTDVTSLVITGSIPKIPNTIYLKIIDKIKLDNKNIYVNNFFVSSKTQYYFFYFRAVLYWFKILEKEPVFLEDGIETFTGEMKEVNTSSLENKYILMAFLSSTLFFIHYLVWSSCQVVNKRDFNFPIDINDIPSELRNDLTELSANLQKDFQRNSRIVSRTYSHSGRKFEMKKQYFYIKKSKAIIDKIDKILCKHFKLSSNEIDFVLNYDYKFRMGSDINDD